MSAIKFKLDVPEVRRLKMYDRAHELCRATNVRIYKRPWAESDWSPYQSMVASTILGLGPDPEYVREGEDVTTQNGRWHVELGIVTAALNETMNEFPDIVTAPMSADTPAKEEPLH